MIHAVFMSRLHRRLIIIEPPNGCVKHFIGSTLLFPIYIIKKRHYSRQKNVRVVPYRGAEHRSKPRSETNDRVGESRTTLAVTLS